MSGEQRAAGCTGCGALYLGEASGGPSCPSCGGALKPAQSRRVAPFERMLERSRSVDEAARAIAAFAGEVWFATPDLASAARPERIQAVWWPRWLVDVDAVGIWEASVGFDYTVESSQEVYDGGRWKTKKVEETRTRFEPRLGRLSRRYDNLSVPALGSEERRISQIGAPDLRRAVPSAERVDGLLQIPDRSPEDQWPLVLAALRERVGQDCGRAAGAQHVEDVFLDIDASGAHWTLLLLPGYATSYRDDEGKTRMLLVDGVTGHVGGVRLASRAVGQRFAMMWFGAGGALFLLGLIVGLVGLLVWVLLPIAGLMLLAGALVGLVGLWPLFAPEQHNRAELQG